MNSTHPLVEPLPKRENETGLEEIDTGVQRMSLSKDARPSSPTKKRRVANNEDDFGNSRTKEDEPPITNKGKRTLTGFNVRKNVARTYKTVKAKTFKGFKNRFNHKMDLGKLFQPSKSSKSSIVGVPITDANDASGMTGTATSFKPSEETAKVEQKPFVQSASTTKFNFGNFETDIFQDVGAEQQFTEMGGQLTLGILVQQLAINDGSSSIRLVPHSAAQSVKLATTAVHCTPPRTVIPVEGTGSEGTSSGESPSTMDDSSDDSDLSDDLEDNVEDGPKKKRQLSEYKQIGCRRPMDAAEAVQTQLNAPETVFPYARKISKEEAKPEVPTTTAVDTNNNIHMEREDDKLQTETTIPPPTRAPPGIPTSPLQYHDEEATENGKNLTAPVDSEKENVRPDPFYFLEGMETFMDVWKGEGELSSNTDMIGGNRILAPVDLNRSFSPESSMCPILDRLDDETEIWTDVKITLTPPPEESFDVKMMDIDLEKGYDSWYGGTGPALEEGYQSSKYEDVRDDSFLKLWPKTVVFMLRERDIVSDDDLRHSIYQKLRTEYDPVKIHALLQRVFGTNSALGRIDLENVSDVLLRNVLYSTACCKHDKPARDTVVDLVRDLVENSWEDKQRREVAIYAAELLREEARRRMAIVGWESRDADLSKLFADDRMACSVLLGRDRLTAHRVIGMLDCIVGSAFGPYKDVESGKMVAPFLFESTEEMMRAQQFCANQADIYGTMLVGYLVEQEEWDTLGFLAQDMVPYISRRKQRFLDEQMGELMFWKYETYWTRTFDALLKYEKAEEEVFQGKQQAYEMERDKMMYDYGLFGSFGKKSGEEVKNLIGISV